MASIGRTFAHKKNGLCFHFRYAKDGDFSSQENDEEQIIPIFIRLRWRILCEVFFIC